MRAHRLMPILACLIAVGAGVAPGDRPRPEVFARAEDQERARLLDRPCTRADIGRGCYREDGQLFREQPCVERSGKDTIDVLPTERCYVMEAPRRWSGVWTDEFENQLFVPDGTAAPERVLGDPSTPGWRERAERAIAASIWLDVGKTHLRRAADARGRRMRLRFIGRRTMYPGEYGHMGMFGNEIVVDRVISAETIG